MDLLARGINVQQDIRVVAATTTELTREACGRHELRGAEAVVLGRALTAGCLLATLTKSSEERVRIQITSEGLLGRILVDARGDGSVRGCLERRLEAVAEPREGGWRPSVGHLVGRTGNLVVTRDLGLENTYQGVVALRSGEIDLDVERYLSDSEQLPSAMVCEVLLDANGDVLRAAGILCQTFPGADPVRLDEVRATLHSSALRDLLLQERQPRELMGFALLGEPFDSKAEETLAFRCNCGRERAIAVVSTLGADDIEALANEPGPTEVRCSYCGASYELSADELLDLASRLRQQRS